MSSLSVTTPQYVLGESKYSCLTHSPARHQEPRNAGWPGGLRGGWKAFKGRDSVETPGAGLVHREGRSRPHLQCVPPRRAGPGHRRAAPHSSSSGKADLSATLNSRSLYPRTGLSPSGRLFQGAPSRVQDGTSALPGLVPASTSFFDGKCPGT